MLPELCRSFVVLPRSHCILLFTTAAAAVVAADASPNAFFFGGNNVIHIFTTCPAVKEKEDN
jgi:hypothetical protein